MNFDMLKSNRMQDVINEIEIDPRSVPKGDEMKPAHAFTISFIFIVLLGTLFIGHIMGQF